MKTVFTNGCFDILHPGHILFLKEAKLLGDLLIVGLNSDYSVSELKPGRPINGQLHRRLMLEALDSVDLVIVFDEPTPAKLIYDIRPSVIVKGSDYTLNDIAGADAVRSWGGSVEILQITPGFSTTSLLDRIKKS